MSAPTLSGGVDLRALLDNLAAQRDGYERLAALAERMLAGLIGGASEDLALLIGEEERQIAALRALEAERLTILAPLARAWNRPATEISARELASVAAPEMGARISAARTALLERLTILRDLNERNRRLLNSAAGILTRWRTLMTASVSAGPVYSEQGRVSAAVTPWALDHGA